MALSLKVCIFYIMPELGSAGLLRRFSLQLKVVTEQRQGSFNIGGIMMRKLLAVFVFAFAGLTQAHAVTIDFEDPALVGPELGGAPMQTQGFEISANAFAVSGDYFVRFIDGQWGSRSLYAEACCWSQDTVSPYAGISIVRSDGQAFALYSLNWASQEISGGATFFSGTTSGGSTVDLSTPLGTGGWLDLVSFSVVSGGGDGFTSSGIASVELDNIVLGAVVPVPAAVWLFGSALGALGWLRRKKSV